MKQNIFETRQRSEELMNQAMTIWRQSDRSDSLEGLENDPVFKMLINAIAYQSIETESEIEELKTELLDEFRKTIVVGEGNKAMPATTVLTMKPTQGIGVLDVTSKVNFTMRGTNRSYNFIPVLNTKLYNAEVKSIKSLDSRRWLVGIDFSDPVENISGMTFFIRNNSFHSVKITIADNGRVLPLIAPWDYSNLPLSDVFSLDTLLYNRKQAVTTGNNRDILTPYYRNCAMDVFARQDAELYIVDDMSDFTAHLHLDFVFEFDGTTDKFTFTDKDLYINAVLIANAEVGAATISSKSPLARIAGMADKYEDKQFMYLLRPEDEQIFAETSVEVRRIYADRFNSGRLQKLLHNLLSKYNSDYYAFQEFGTGESDAIVQRVRRDMRRLEEMSSKQSDSYEGVYLILADNTGDQAGHKIEEKNITLDIKYLTTDGASLNKDINSIVTFDVPEGIASNSVSQIAIPQTGMDEVYDDSAEIAISRYFHATDDRLVTPADIKLFCLMELSARYGITQTLVNSIRISRKPIVEGNYRTYLTVVSISLNNTIFVQRALAEKIASVQHYLKKMIEVRTNGMYPVDVELHINE